MGPLVSILIPNFNHSKYLGQCIESAMNQTYDNLEILVLDNDSTDDSVEVSLQYLYDSRIRVLKNPFNILNRNYHVLTELALGEYALLLCADDYIEPDFVQRAVDIMEKYPKVAYVHGEKDFVQNDGTIIPWDPFFNCSFIAPGINIMPIYLMTTIAHPAQGIFRMSAFRKIDGYDKEIDHMNADKTLWFYLSYGNDMAYIRDKMCNIRIGNQTETYITQKNYQHPILCHLTILDFVKFAYEKEIPEIYNRNEEALEKLSYEFLDYAIGMVWEKDYVAAEQYLKYAHVVNKKIDVNQKYQLIYGMIKAKEIDKSTLEKYKIRLSDKQHNYTPPIGYTEI